MRRFLVALALVPWSPVFADPPPPGSYQQTCAGVKFDKPSLAANCRTIGGKYHASNLNTEFCQPGSVFNSDGTLTCFAVKATKANGPVVWPGSYVKSCRWPQVVDNGKTLFAGCNSGGKVHSSNLNLRKCAWGKDIANNHGTLTC